MLRGSRVCRRSAWRPSMPMLCIGVPQATLRGAKRDRDRTFEHVRLHELGGPHTNRIASECGVGHMDEA
eukprot:8492524-Alexandrium_andersonii.AAC.1